MKFDVNFDATMESLVPHTGLGSVHCDVMRCLAYGLSVNPKAWAALKLQVDGPAPALPEPQESVDAAALALAKALYVTADPECAAACTAKIKKALLVAQAEGWTMALQAVGDLERKGDPVDQMGVRLAKQRLERGAEAMWTGRR